MPTLPTVHRGLGILKRGIMNVLDCDTQALNDLLERLVVVGDRVNLPDGVYASADDSLAAVVMRGRFISELELFNEYGEAYVVS